jgi:hypothetical protein
MNITRLENALQFKSNSEKPISNIYIISFKGMHKIVLGDMIQIIIQFLN